MKCEVCGRTEEELVEEFGNQVEIKDHQGIKKCSKCIREYEVESQEDSTESTDRDDPDWKDEVMA